MLFSSLSFIFYFLPVALVLSFLFPKTQHKNIFLIIAGLVFYIWGEGSFVAVLAGSALMNYAFGLLAGGKKNSRMYLVIGIIANLAVLINYKYLGYLVVQFHLDKMIPPGKMANHMPLGISFFTFQGLSYIIDVYRNKELSEKNPLKVLTYITLFPQLLSGPIVRYPQVRDQLNNRTMTNGQMVEGIRRFILGLSKKMLIANPLSFLITGIFTYPISNLGTTAIWLGVIAYTLQIFFDFSGYSDMAIGIAGMLGFRYPENFNFPYISRSVKEFWTRWHISLSTWLRDYLFLPIAYSVSRKLNKDSYLGLRTDKWIYVFSALITMFICGLWHGANFTFILWGLWLAAFLIMEQLFLARWLKHIGNLRIIYTLLVIINGWVIFRSDDFSNALRTFAGMYGFNSGGQLGAIAFLNSEYILVLIMAVIFTMPLSKRARAMTAVFATRKKSKVVVPGSTGNPPQSMLSQILSIFPGKYINITFEWLRNKEQLVNLAGMGIYFILFLISCLAVVSDTYNPFIYFRF
ncbi:MAG: MBOAT family protein [Bacteroidia bacterium]|nr:MBOAT family protein [Bacteroidia bacterium]